MKLYHGTNGRRIPEILQHGIQPRGKKRGNWQRTVTSNPNAVYLTDAYALYFAMVASDNDLQLGVIEVETDRMEEVLFLPDEDFLEQATRKFEGNTKGRTMKQRTLWYRRHAWEYQSKWELSLKHMGTCCYYDTILPRQITKAVVIDGKKRNDILAEVLDPTVTLLHYKFLGERYRSIVRWLVGQEVDMKMLIPFPELEFKTSFGQEYFEHQKEQVFNIYSNRSGIETLYEEK